MSAQVLAPVLAVRPVGSYTSLVLEAPAVARTAAPGRFVALAVGGPVSALLLRRSFSIASADPDAGTVEVVVAVAGPGTAWLAARRPGDVVDVVGALGRPFPLPDAVAPLPHCVLVGGGYGAAPLPDLARALLGLGCVVDVVLGAGSADRLLAVDVCAELTATTVTTDDGSAGERGLVTGPLERLVGPGSVVYACGPMAMLRAVSALAARRGALAHTAVEEAMACGIGVCMTCVLPVVGDDGRTRMVRSCVEGPVFRGDRVRWDDVGTVPGDAEGAPRLESVGGGD